MTVTEEDILERPTTEIQPARVHAVPETSTSPAGEAGQGEDRHVKIGWVAGAVFLMSSAAAWATAGLIRGIAPRVISLIGVAIGVGLTYLSYRSKRRNLVQYAIVPIAAFVGAALIAPEATGGTANLPSLVVEAIRAGGLLQTPIPFEPGWRFILVVLFSILGTAALATAVTTRRPKVGVLLPLPIVVGAILLQPQGTEVLASAVSTAFVVGALALAYGADRAEEENRALGRSYEIRRLGRGVAMLAIVTAGIVAVANVDFLFPQTEKERVIPPQRPPNVPPEPDRELFRAHSEFKGPWRIGVLDVYDGEFWLLPSQDPARIKTLRKGIIPIKDLPRSAPDAELQTVTLTIVDMKGRTLPVPSQLVAIEDAGSVEYDPRPGTPRLPKRIPRGFKFDAIFMSPPRADQMNDAPNPPARIVEEFGKMPPAPNSVINLLSQAPPDRFTSLQFLREKLYETVVSAGGGAPVAVTPSRVGEMLEPSAEATPFEIAAAEAMLARWAGLPARIGYGYHGGNPFREGFSLRPKDAKAWLETYFEGYGWIPLIGNPPRGKASLTESQKLTDPNVRPSEDLSMIVYIAIQRKSPKLLFEIVRYWVLVALPFLVAGLALYFGYPSLLKRVRSGRRRRWGIAHGPLGRALTAYGDFRDLCYDLNLGDVRDTPLEFVERFVPDEEHDELAWLTTRLFWSDLRRDVRDDDARAAEEMVASVRKRVLQSHPPIAKLLGGISRASLKDPYSDQIPNFYPQIRLRKKLRRIVGALRVLRLTSKGRVPKHSTAMLFMLSLLLVSCVKQGGFEPAEAPTEFPEQIAPDNLLGYRFVREPVAEVEYSTAGPEALVTEGRVYTIQEGTSVHGALQISLFRKNLNARDLKVQRQVVDAMGGSFQPFRIGTVRILVRQLREQTFYLWFPPERNVMTLFIMRRQFTEAERLIRGVIAYQRGLNPERLTSFRPSSSSSSPISQGVQEGTG